MGDRALGAGLEPADLGCRAVDGLMPETKAGAAKDDLLNAVAEARGPSMDAVPAIARSAGGATSKWRATGYFEPRIFPGAAFCRYRLCHVRDDRLIVLTLGHYVTKGRLEYVGDGHNFVTWVFRVEDGAEEESEDGARKAKLLVFDRHGANHWAVAESQHYATLDVWEHEPAKPEDAKPERRTAS